MIVKGQAENKKKMSFDAIQESTGFSPNKDELLTQKMINKFSQGSKWANTAVYWLKFTLSGKKEDMTIKFNSRIYKLPKNKFRKPIKQTVAVTKTFILLNFPRAAVKKI